jgi:tetratricopeptide (TPR) repeat protein
MADDFNRNVESLAEVLNDAEGETKAWLDAVGAIVHGRGVDPASSSAMSTLIDVRGLQYDRQIPNLRLSGEQDAADDEPFRARVQIELALDEVISALRWYESRSLRGNADETPLDAIVEGLMGDFESAAGTTRRLLDAYPSTQTLHHFAYLVLKSACDIEGAVLEAGRSADLASAMSAAGLYMDCAKVQQRQGDHRGAWKSLVSGLEARPQTPWINEFAATVFEWMGAFEEAEALYARSARLDPDRFGPRAALARLKTWRGLYDSVLPDVVELLGAHPDEGILHRLLGIIHVGEGRLEEGRASLTRALALLPRDSQALLWRAETFFKQGRYDEALADIELASVTSGNPAESLQRLLLDLTHVEKVLGRNDPCWCFSGKKYKKCHMKSDEEVIARGEPQPGAFLKVVEFRHTAIFHNGFLHRHLPHLCSPEDLERTFSGGPEMRAVFEAALTRLGGNRGDIVTLRSPGASEGVPDVIRRVELPVNSREASAAALKQLRYVPVEEVFAQFDEVLKNYPDSPHPYCYRGELNVWLGRYDEALADFEAALKISRVRWGFVGKAAVLMLRGQRAEALEQVNACNAAFDPIPGATTHVYLGELLRREGDYAGAAFQLNVALSVKPSRHGAWMNLALVYRAQGQIVDAEKIYTELWSNMPGLLWVAGQQVDIPLEQRCDPAHMETVIEEALAMMRGNRSSHLLTFFPRDGRLRILPLRGVWEEVAWETLSLAEERLLENL